METMKIVEGRSGRVWPAVLRTVTEGRRNGRRVILYVPEQLTLQAERDLVADLELDGLLDIEVISPRKLRVLVREKTGGSGRRTLNEAGQIMAVHRAMAEQNDTLIYYRNMAELPGAVNRVREALSELRESDFTAEELEEYAARCATGAMQAKIRDLNRINSTYEALVTERFEDEKTAWTETVKRLGRTELFRDADLLVYGFDTIRPDLRELLCKTAALVHRAIVFLTGDGADAGDALLFQEQNMSIRRLQDALEETGAQSETIRIRTPRENSGRALQWMDAHLFTEDGEVYDGETGDEVTLYAAADGGDEAEQVAGCLLKWHSEGIPWERMVIALPRSSALEGVLRSRLRLNGIPVCGTEKIPMVSHGVCRMLTAALECIHVKYTADLMTEAALSGFTALTDEEALVIGNYAAAHRIEGRRWRQPFTRGENAAEAEIIRQKLVGPIEALRDELKAAKNADASVAAVVHFLEAQGVRERLKAREERLLEEGLYSEAVVDRQIWNTLVDVLDQLWTLLGSRRATMRDMRNLLESAMCAAEVATLPETESGVMLGGIGHMLPGDTDALILPGCQEGILTAPESGWLSDRERQELESGTGREIGISRERRGWIRRYDFYRTVTIPRRHLRISWSLRDEKGSPLQEDGLVAAIRRIFPKIAEEGGIRGEGERFDARTPLKGLETLGVLFAQMQEGKRDPEAEKAAVALLHSGVYGRTARRIAEEALHRYGTQKLRPDTATRLFRTEGISISRLEGYAACPYRHFIDYGLRPVRQEAFDFDSADAGNFFHAALDRYVKTAGAEADWPAMNDERVDGIMDAVCAELTEEWEGGPLHEDALGIWQGEEYQRRVRHAAKALTRFAANSDFRIIATEQSFGTPGGLPPMVLNLADGSRVSVHGIIDRIDLYENGEGVWLRIVDNKSAEKKPDAAKMADGEQLQLMIYLRAATRANSGAKPAGAMFFPVRDTEVSGTDETPEAVREERIKKVRMKGLVNAREDIVRAMDRDLQPYSIDEVFNKKDGTVRKSADWAVDGDTLEGLMAAAENKAAEIVGEIRTGRIEAAPRGKEEDAACVYCTYRTLCHVRRDSYRPRPEGITFRDVAGKNTLRESE